MAISGAQKAPQFFLSGACRVGLTRSGYHSAKTFIKIGGVERRSQVIASTVSIQQALNDRPDTASFRCRGFTPTKGQEVIIRLGSINNGNRLFAGVILSTKAVCFEKPTSANGFVDVSAIDYGWTLDTTKLFIRYQNLSATAILQDICDRFQVTLSGFSTAAIQSGLPVIDEITFTAVDFITAVSRVVTRIGAYWYVDAQKVIHAFVGDEVGLTPPRLLTASHPSLADLEQEDDIGPQFTRVSFEGGGGSTSAAVSAGVTVLPIDSLDKYNLTGGVVTVGPQRLTYTGATIGATIPYGPTVAIAAGAGIESGVHQYAFTWVTAAGETLPSPIASIDVGHTVAEPTTAPALQNSPFNVFGHSIWAIGQNVYIVVTYLNALGETIASAQSNTVVAQQAFGSFVRDLDATSVPVSPDPSVTTKKIYVNANGSWVANGSFPNINPNRYDMIQTGVVISSASAPPGTNTTAGNQVTISTIAVGPTDVTQRKVYRTVAGGAALKLLTTIANNTSTGPITDSAADASLGAAVPAVDTSALKVVSMTTTNGVTAAGAASMTVVSTTGFASSGIVLIGYLAIAYTGTTATTFTGIPATGFGSVPTSIPTATEVQSANALTGIADAVFGTPGVVVDIAPGEPVNLVVTVTDTVAQAARAALLGNNGVKQDYQIDNRLRYTEALARATALLTQRKDSAGAAKGSNRDLNLIVGRMVTIPAAFGPYIAGSYRVQDVEITQFSENGAAYPLRRFVASSYTRSFEDVLRSIPRTT